MTTLNEVIIIKYLKKVKMHQINSWGQILPVNRKLISAPGSWVRSNTAGLKFYQGLHSALVNKIG